jgi:phosphoribosylformylglycinamidine synthase
MARANVYVSLKKDILDPQGQAVKNALHSLGYSNVKDVRVGKYIVLTLEQGSEENIGNIVEDICKKVLSNPVIEDFTFDIVED